MCSPLNCGTSNFPAEEYDVDELLCPCKLHTKSTSKKNKGRSSKNPYADRGRDKFDALLAELESKKQKIYTQKGSQDISFIRFAYSSSGEWKPIVVKAKNKIRSEEDIRPSNVEKGVVKNVMKEATSKLPVVIKESNGGIIMSKSSQVKSSRSWSYNLKLNQPFFYLSLMLIFILFLLSIFGKTFAIFLTTIGWYLLPLFIKDKAKNSIEGGLKKKVVYTRKLSERTVVMNIGSASPISVLDGPEDKSPAPAKHAHRKSW